MGSISRMGIHAQKTPTTYVYGNITKHFQLYYNGGDLCGSRYSPSAKHNGANPRDNRTKHGITMVVISAGVEPALTG